MSSAITPVTPVDVGMTTAMRQQKTQSPDDGKFKDMLSGAANENIKAGGVSQQQNEAAKDVEKPTETQAKTAKAESPKQAEEQTKVEEQSQPEDDGVSEENDSQVVAAVMQMGIMLPVVTPVVPDIPQVEIPAETDIAVETVDFQTIQPVQTMTAETTSQVDIETSDEFSVPDISGQAVEATKPQVDIESESQPEQVKAADEPEIKTAKATQATQPAQMEQTIQAAESQESPEANRIEPSDRVQRQTARRENPEVSTKNPEEATEDTAPEVIIPPQHSVQMHNMRHTRRTDAAQTRFDDMVTKASQELNKSVASEEPPQETELPEETQTLTQTDIPSTEPGKPAEQAKVPETEIKPENEQETMQETKPTARATVQKSEKAPITEQRPQKEISKSDEAVLGMVQQKTQPLVDEVIRSEPTPIQHEQVQIPDQSEQIKAQLIKEIEIDKTEFQMQLHPEELGKIDVKMILEGGKLVVEIAAANPKSSEILSKQVESLIASLKASNIDVTAVNVVTASENASGNMSSEYNLNNFQNQFQNRDGGQGRSGSSTNAGASNGQASENGQNERENPESPQRMLNYSV